MPGRRQLVGRAAELALAESDLRAGRSVVLGGHAGIGKTRLARELADRWSPEHGSAWISGTAGSSGLPGAAVLRFVPAEAGAAELGEQALVVAALAEARRLPERLIVVDDAHDLDDLSALVVQQLVLDGTVPVLITVRSGEAVTPTVSMLWSDGWAERIDLQPLSQPETGDLGGALLGHDLHPETVAALFASSQGNPLLLLELVRDALDAGTLVQVDGTWSWDGGVGRAIRIRDTIQRRLDGLGPAARDLLAALAVAQPLGLSILETLAPDVDLLEAERRGLISIEVHDRRREARLAHPLLGEVLVAGAPDRELADLRRRVADHVESRGARRRTDLLLVAKLRLDAGDASDTTVLLRAAARALELGSPDLGIELARAVLVADPASVQALLLLGEGSVIARREAEAAVHLEAAIDLVTSDHDRMRIAQSLHQVYRLLEQPERVQPMLDRIRAGISDHVWQGVVDSMGCQQLMFEGRSRAGVAWGEEVLARHDDPRVRLRLLGTVPSGWVLAGRTADGLTMVGDLLPVALELQHELHLAPAWVMNAQGLGLMVAGRLDEAMAFVELVRGIVASQHVSAMGGGGHPMLQLFAGRIELTRGNVAGALAELEPAVAALGDDDISGLSEWAISLLAEATALSGSLDEATALARRAEGVTSTMRLYEGDARRGRAWVRALGGELQCAIDALVELAALQQLEGQHGLEIVTLHDAVRLGAGKAARERLLEVTGLVDSRYGPAYRRHVEALATGDGADLEAAAAALEELGLQLEAAEVFAAAASAHERAGLKVRAAAAGRRSEDLLALSGSVRTPGLQGQAARAELTQREREVAVLAARGLSNKDIAETLFVSVRTAEGHLYRACTKLGVTDRTELTALLGGSLREDA